MVHSGCSTASGLGVGQASPNYLELSGREREVAVEHRVEDCDKGHVRHDGLEQRWAHVEARADKHSARRAANNRHVARRGVLVLRELVGDRDEVEKGALLREELGGLIPRLAQVAAASDVRGGDHEPQVCVQRVRVPPDRLLGDAVRAIAFEQQWHRAILLKEALLVQHGHRHTDG